MTTDTDKDRDRLSNKQIITDYPDECRDRADTVDNQQTNKHETSIFLFIIDNFSTGFFTD